jgi:hypothetical protein
MFEDRVRQASDLLLKRLRGEIEGQVQALAEELLHVAREEQHAASLETRHAVEGEAAAALEAALAGARAEAHDMLAAETASLRAENEAALAAADQARTRAVKEAREERDAAARQALRDAEVALVQARADAAAATAQARAAHEQLAAASAETAALRAQLEEVGRRQAGAIMADPADGAALTGRLRALDVAHSLSEVLETLAEVAEAEAGRAAVLLVQGGRLRGWRFAGFGPAAGSLRDLDLPAEQPGIVSRALQTGQPWSTQPDAAGRTAQAPPFARLPADRTGLALPIRVGGRIAGIVYADDCAEDASTRRPAERWREGLETIVRYAGRCLEALTAQRTPRALAAVRATAETAAGPPAQDEQGARRCARLLLSEIKVYHEAAVQAGREQRDLLSRLRPEIERVRRLFDERVPATMPARNACFEEELVRTLAGGDPSLLGGEVAL